MAGPERRARLLVFDDGTEPRQVAASIVRQFALHPGSVVNPPELVHSLAAAEFDHAKQRALQLVGYRERSEADLASRLVATGFPPEVAAAVVARFVEVELVDDRRFASAYARSRTGAGYGDRRIARELRARGVDELLISEILQDRDQSQTQLARARAALHGRTAADPAAARRLVRRLVTRGFDLSVALQAVEADVEAADVE